MPKKRKNRAQAEPDTVVLRKYSNRRLYDTTESRYVTLADVAEMVRQGRDVRVEEAGSGRDITKSVLLQVIIESEQEAALLPISFLRKIIEAGSSSAADSFRTLLSSSMELFCDMIEKAQKDWQSMDKSGLPLSFQWIEFMNRSMLEFGRALTETSAGSQKRKKGSRR